MMLSSGQTVSTLTGRMTTPFPRVTASKRNAAISKMLKAVDRWLIQNAIAEARARNDVFALQQFEIASGLPSLSTSDRDCASDYLFG